MGVSFCLGLASMLMTNPVFMLSFFLGEASSSEDLTKRKLLLIGMAVIFMVGAFMAFKARKGK